jgi:23S rRNA (uracil1939-C5)-methyltransferase
LTALAQRLLKNTPGAVGIAFSLREPRDPRVLGQEPTALAGEGAVRDRVGAAFHYATFGSFVQVHREQAKRLHGALVERMRQEFGSLDKGRVLELYGGSGSIGLDLALAGAQVDMVESYGPAATVAARAAREQGLQNRFRVVAGDAWAAGRHFVQGAGRPYDLVVVNPPRRGLAAGVRELVATANPRAVAYVSCDPDTLARDLEHLRRLGYAADSVTPFDMIPLTEEVEAFVWLRRSPVPAPEILYEDDEVLVVDKGPNEPTTPQPEHFSSLIGRAQKIGAGSQDYTAVRRLEVGTSGVCLLAKTVESAARWAKALDQPTARTTYAVGCRGISPAKGSIRRELREGGRMVAARTRYWRQAVFGGHSILRVVPDQALPHQIRRHLASIGHPVLGDDRYGHGPTNRFFEEKHTLDRCFQHCVRIEVNHPTLGLRLVFEAPLPGDLQTTLHRSAGSPTLLFLAQKHALGT